MRNFLLLTVLTLCIPFKMDAQAISVKKGNVKYELENGKAVIVGFDEKAEKVTILDSVIHKKRTYKVVDIKRDSKQNPCYKGNSFAIREMVFAEGVTDVYDQMAMNMAKLEKVVLPSTLSSIGQSAFSSCTSLVEINIPDSVKSIGQWAFRDCSSLKQVEIPRFVRSLGGGLFYGCSALKKVTIKMAVNMIPAFFFRDCKSLYSILWRPQYIKSIGTEAFRGCTSLKTMKVPSNVTKISTNAFFDCTSLKAIRLPEGLTEISEGVFHGCTSLETVSLPAKVKTIGRIAFQNCTSLASVSLPDSITTIGKESFKSCSSLKEIAIPNSVKFVADEAFGKCSNLEDVILPDSAMFSKRSFDGCTRLTNIKCHNGSVPTDVYFPKTCLFVLNGRKSENQEIDKQQAKSVTDGGTAKFVRKDAQNVLKADVDYSIPITKNVNDSTFAIIIGNENYKQVPHVAYAEHDAVKFAEYCLYTLGLPEKNINVIYDASYTDMSKAIHDLQSAFSDNADNYNLIFYYSGHGVPNESSRDAYLLPIDADARTTEKCYAVSELYKDLSGLKAKRILVFLDACFSGSQRNGGVLHASARGVAIKPKDVEPMQNMVVYSAASGDETAYPFEGRSHGMFTYYLLKKLKETQGKVTLGELADYVKTNVGKTSVLENKKSQTPTVSTSRDIADDWEDMELR